MKKFLYALVFFTTPFYGMLRRRMYVNNYNSHRQSSSNRSENDDIFSQNYVNPLENFVFQTQLQVASLVIDRLQVRSSQIEREPNANTKKERESFISRNCNSKRTN